MEKLQGTTLGSHPVPGGGKLIGMLVAETRLGIHGLGGFGECEGEGFAGAVKFSTNRIRSLPGEFPDLLITQLLIGNQQEQQTVFRRQSVERPLNPLSQFLGFQNAKRIGRSGPGGIKDGIVGDGMDVSRRPGLPEVGTMIERDPVKPGSDLRLPPKLAVLSEGLQENIVNGVLGLDRIAQQPQCEIENGLSMEVIDLGKI